MMQFIKTITPPMWRVIVFLGLFVAISGLVGPRIISGGIMERDGFAAYGGVGKALIFGFIAFALLARHNKTQVVLKAWQPVLLWWMAAALPFFILSWLSVDNLLAGRQTAANLIFAHGGLLFGLVLVGISCFGPKNLQLLWEAYKREISYSLLIAVLFYIFLTFVYSLWRPLASVVLAGVKGLLDITGPYAMIVPPYTLIFDKFGVTIAEFCSGIESIALFTSLYIIAGLLDWKRLNHKRYFIVFPFALLLLFGLNIVRVYGLIMAGYHINPEIAFSLFHTYAGMVFFIIYSAAFWAVAYKHLLAKPQTV